MICQENAQVSRQCLPHAWLLSGEDNNQESQRVKKKIRFSWLLQYTFQSNDSIIKWIALETFRETCIIISLLLNDFMKISQFPQGGSYPHWGITGAS